MKCIQSPCKGLGLGIPARDIQVNPIIEIRGFWACSAARLGSVPEIPSWASDDDPCPAPLHRRPAPQHIAGPGHDYTPPQCSSTHLRKILPLHYPQNPLSPTVTPGTRPELGHRQPSAPIDLPHPFVSASDADSRLGVQPNLNTDRPSQAARRKQAPAMTSVHPRAVGARPGVRRSVTRKLPA